MLADVLDVVPAERLSGLRMRRVELHRVQLVVPQDHLRPALIDEGPDRPDHRRVLGSPVDQVAEEQDPPVRFRMGPAGNPASPAEPPERGEEGVVLAVNVRNDVDRHADPFDFPTVTPFRS